MPLVTGALAPPKLMANSDAATLDAVHVGLELAADDFFIQVYHNERDDETAVNELDVLKQLGACM